MWGLSWFILATSTLFVIVNSQLNLQTFGILMRYEMDNSVNDTLKMQQILKFYESLTCSYKIIQVVFQVPIERIQQKSLNLQAMSSSLSTIVINFSIQPVESQANIISPNSKFKTPKSNLEEIYFLTNANLYMNFGCSELQQMLEAYQVKLIGELGPLVGYFESGHTYQTKDQPVKINKKNILFLQYIQNSNSAFYSMINLEHAFVSKHFLDLYYTNMTDVVAIRAIVDKHKSCQSIALNCLVSMYYPQLKPIKIARSSKLLIQAFQYGKNSKNQIKNACLKDILQLYGYFPLINYATNSTNTGLQQWENPAYSQNVNTKKEYIDKFIQLIKKQAAISKATPTLTETIKTITQTGQKSTIPTGKTQTIQKTSPASTIPNTLILPTETTTHGQPITQTDPISKAKSQAYQQLTYHRTRSNDRQSNNMLGYVIFIVGISGIGFLLFYLYRATLRQSYNSVLPPNEQQENEISN